MNLRKSHDFLAVFLLLAFTLPCRADVLFVNAEGTGEYPTIQAAVDAAVDEDEVHLSDGVYQGDGNYEIDFRGKAIAVRSESMDPYKTIILVDAYDFIRRAFILNSSEGSPSIQGLLITGGWVEDAPPDIGVVSCSSASPSITDCVFANNRGTSIGSNGGSPTITRCLFEDNSSRGQGSCVYSSGPYMILDCTFRRNHSSGSGGAVYGPGSIAHCRFEENSSSNLGGAVWGASSIEYSLFDTNNAGLGGALATLGPLTCNHCLFNNNYAILGGAVLIDSGGNCSIANSTLVRNHGFADGETIQVSSYAYLNLTNAIVGFGQGKAGEFASSIFLEGGSSADLSCVDIFGNAAGDWEGAIENQLGYNGNISVDPLFCDLDSGNYDINATSLCAPAHSNGCGLIGLYDVGCEPSSVEAKSWGRIKGMYR